MSYFQATCPKCGVTYTHLFVGSTLYAGHVCPPRGTDEKAARAIQEALKVDPRS